MKLSLVKTSRPARVIALHEHFPTMIHSLERGESSEIHSLILALCFLDEAGESVVAYGV